MSNSIQVQKTQQDISDLNDDYKRRRKEISEQNEQALESLKDVYQKKMADTRSSGEAAVNHIKKQTRENIESVREESGQRIVNENQVAEDKIRSARVRNANQQSQLETKLENQNNYYNQLLDKSREAKKRSIANENQQTEKVRQEQIAIRNDFQKTTANELDEDRQKFSTAKSQVLERSRTELDQMNQKIREDLKKAQQDNNQRIERQRAEAYETLRHQEQRQSQVLKKEQQAAEYTLHNLQQTSQEEYLKERTRGEKKFQDTRVKNDKTLESETARGLQAREKARKDYDNQIKEIHQTGEGELKTQKDHFTKQNQLQTQAFEDMMDEKQKSQDRQLKQNDEIHHQKLEAREVEYRRMLRNQRGEFDSAYLKNEKVNRDALMNQADRLTDALVKQQSGYLEKFAQFENTKNDPFYKVQKFETQLSEDENFYVLKTKLPEHEVKNVNIIVKDNQVSVSGNREFSEQINTDGRKISTNTAQTFREVIPLKHPTLPKHVEKTYADGTLTVRIPKIPIR